MIELFAAPTPNSQKIGIMLEEIGLPYEVNIIDLSKGEHCRPEYLQINPNGKVPTIIDREASVKLFESGAILLYLAEKTGKLLPRTAVERAEVYQWLMFEMSGLGPTGNQFAHFGFYAAEKIPYAIQRYQQEILRLLAVLNSHLEGREFLGAEYSVADISTFPLINALTYFGANAGIVVAEFPHLQRWANTLLARPAVQRGLAFERQGAAVR